MSGPYNRKCPRYWKPEIDSEEDRWLCEFCGSELHTECVDDKCPVCGARVRGEIVKILKRSGRVTVYALNPHEYEWNGLLVDPIAAIEHILIKSLDPEWNLQHTKTGQPKRGTYWSN
jgi:hypothetical protein